MSRIVHRSALACLLLMLLAGCGNAGKSDGSAASPPRLELRAYTVPADRTDPIRMAIYESLRTGQTTVGSVSSPMPGQLLVLAPADLQEGVAGALKTLAADQKAAPAALSAQYRLQFWIVDALRGPGNDDPALSVVSAATAEARKQLGDVHFILRDSVSAVSRAQWPVRKQWATFSAGDRINPVRNHLNYKLFGLADGLNMDFEFGEDLPIAGAAGSVQYSSNNTSTTMAVRSGQVTVLSQGPATGDGQPATNAVRLYVVRVDALGTT